MFCVGAAAGCGAGRGSRSFADRCEAERDAENGLDAETKNAALGAQFERATGQYLSSDGKKHGLMYGEDPGTLTGMISGSMTGVGE